MINKVSRALHPPSGLADRHGSSRLIREFVPPKRLTVRVLLDAFCLCPVAMRACQTRGFHQFSVASKNRNAIRTPGKKRGHKWRIKDLAPGVLNYQGNEVRLPHSRG